MGTQPTQTAPRRVSPSGPPSAAHKKPEAGQGTPAPAFRLSGLLSWSALQSIPLPPDEPIISPWLNSGESCLLWGGTGSGKSMVAMSLALAVAGGGRVFGWTCPKPRRVLWVDGEMSQRTICKRLPFLAQTVEGLSLETAQENLTIYARTMAAPGERTLDINDAEHASELVDYAKREGAALVVFDNLSTLSDGIEDENAAASFKPMQALCAKLKGANVACLMVHHAGKLGTSYRGSSNIGTTFERILGIIHDPEEPATKLSASVSLEKFRDEAPEGFSPEFHLELAKTLQGPRWLVKDSSPDRAAYKLFAEGDHCSIAEFVSNHNARTGEKRAPKNFRRDFRDRWKRTGIPEDRIAEAEAAMKDRAEAGRAEGAEAGGQDF